MVLLFRCEYYSKVSGDAMKNEKRFGLMVDGDILAKFHYVCGYCGRPVNNQIIRWMLKCILDFERGHGEIHVIDDMQKYKNLPA